MYGLRNNGGYVIADLQAREWKMIGWQHLPGRVPGPGSHSTVERHSSKHYLGSLKTKTTTFE